MKVFGEGLHNFQVALHGSLRVITTLEFLQHHCSELGHRDLLVTHKISPSGLEMLDRPTRVASAARAASLCAGHAQQFGGESPPANLMEVKA